MLASEAPLVRPAAELPAAEALPPLAGHAYRRLAEAVGTLPLSRTGHPYHADALAADHRQDTPWHQVRLLLRLSRYAQEVIAPERADARLAEAGRALERHRDAAEAATAAAAAARTPRIAPATAYALGVLHADQRHEVAAARFAFGRVWLPAPRPRLVPDRGTERAEPAAAWQASRARTAGRPGKGKGRRRDGGTEAGTGGGVCAVAPRTVRGRTGDRAGTPPEI